MHDARIRLGTLTRLACWLAVPLASFGSTLSACNAPADSSNGGEGGALPGGGAGAVAGRSGGIGMAGDGGGGMTGCLSEGPRLVVSWHQLQTTGGPGPRTLHAAAATPNGLLLFGGADGQTELSDTWSLTDTTWESLPTEPPGRAGHALVATADSTLLFGGVGVDGLLADTWLWQNGWRDPCSDGACASTPPARASHRMAFDRGSEKVVLFGGSRGVPSGDSWLWDGTNGWQQVCAQAASGEAGASGAGPAICQPSPRQEHAMAYDPETKRVLMFGGHDGRTELNDLWAFESGTWVEIDDARGNAPEPVSAHAMEYDPDGRVMLIVGGLHGSLEAEASFGLLTDQLLWLRAKDIGELPRSRAHGSLSYDRAGQRMIYYGDGAWTVTTSLVTAEDHCGCVSSCASVCPTPASFCEQRCLSGVNEAPDPSQCMTLAEGGSGGIGEAGGQAGAGPLPPMNRECQSLWDCCTTLDEQRQSDCRRAASADDVKICIELEPLCGALQGDGGTAQGEQCIALGSCCANLKGSLYTACFALLSGADADCAEFLMGGYCPGR
jgi:hypothetical protein